MTRKAELIRHQQEEIDRRTRLEDEAIALVSEGRYDEARELMESLDDSILEDIQKEIKALGTERRVKTDAASKGHDHVKSKFKGFSSCYGRAGAGAKGPGPEGRSVKQYCLYRPSRLLCKTEVHRQDCKGFKCGSGGYC